MINRLIKSIDRWFIWSLPWVCAGSFFTKKYLLVACGAVALTRMLFLKGRVLFWGDWFVFFFLNAWLVVATLRLSFFGVPLSDSYGGLQAYDFKRSFIIALAFFVCADAVYQKFGLRNALKLFSISLGVSIGLFVAFVLIRHPDHILNLYPLGWRLTSWLGWGFDDICGMLGIWFFVMVASKRNRSFDWLLYFFGLLLLLSLGRRPTIFYAGFLLSYFLKDLFFQQKINCRRLVFWILLLVIMVAIAYFVVDFDHIARLKNIPIVQRLLWTMDGGWAQEVRFILVRIFVDKYDFLGLFGGYLNAAKVTGGLESFHNLLLDGFWYGGWIGGVLVLLGLTLLVLRCIQSRDYIALVMMLFIITGLLMAAPPFSNQFAFALVLPLFLGYLRNLRSTKRIYI